MKNCSEQARLLNSKVAVTRRSRYRYVRWRWRALFTLVDALGALVFRLLRCFAPSGQPTIAPEQVRRVLLVQLDHLGDAIISLPMLPALQARFPQARIEVLAAPWNEEVFRACPQVRRVHVSRRNRFGSTRCWDWLRETWSWGWRLRRRRYDLAIDVRGEFPQTVLMWLAGARRRVGWDCGGGGFLLTDRAHYVPGRAEWESRRALLALSGTPTEDFAAARSFDPGHEARRHVGALLSKTGFDHQPLVVVHPGARTQAKRWPAESWRELLGRLIVDVDPRIILVGAAAEVDLARGVTQGLEWPGVHDWTGRLNLVQLAALLEQARQFIGGDSGPAHLAAAMGTPSVVLFSGTNQVSQWRPWGEHVSVLSHPVACSPCHRQRCPLADHPCMTNLLPRDVADLVSRRLEDDPRRLPATRELLDAPRLQRLEPQRSFAANAIHSGTQP